MHKVTETLVAYILTALCGITLLASVLAAAHIGVLIVWGLVNLFF